MWLRLRQTKIVVVRCRFKRVPIISEIYTGRLGAIEGSKAVEAFLAGLFVLVEGEGSGKGAKSETAIAAARAARKLQHDGRQQSQAQREPAPRVGRDGGQQLQDTFDHGRLLGFEGPAGAAAAPVPERTVGAGVSVGRDFRFLGALVPSLQVIGEQRARKHP